MTAAQKIFLHKLYWFAYTKLSSLFDLLLLLFPKSKLQEGKGKTIVFIGEQLPPRIARMAKWLKRSGDFTIYLVCSKQGFVKDFSGEGFEKVLLFRNKWHLFRIVSGFGPNTILHGFAPKSRLLNLVRKRSGLKYIHDMQDVYSIYYGLETTIPHLKIELPHERECLEKADAVVAQSLEPNIAYRMYGTKKKPRNIFFPLYCDDDQFQNNTKDLNGEIHLVYAGGVAGKHRDPKQYGNIQFHSLIESFARQKIHFHLYPAPSSLKADYEEYRLIQKSNSYFHFHEATSQ